MLPLGHNLMISSDGMSWLFWVHLLVMFLLVILLSNLTIFGFDVTDKGRGSDFICKDQNKMKDLRSSNNNNSNRLQDDQVNEGQRTSTISISTRNTRRSEIEANEMEASSIRELKETTSMACYFNNPCYYLNLAKRVFLKCLGLDSNSEDSSTTQQPRTQ